MASHLLHLLWICYFSTGLEANHDARRLYDDLLRKSGYNKLIRPVGNNSDTLTVFLGLRLSQLIDVVSTKFVTNFVTLCAFSIRYSFVYTIGEETLDKTVYST